MDKQELEKFIGNESLTVSEAMQRIDKNQLGILFIISQNKRLTGCITDGDVRRYLLAGGKMEDCAANAANRTPRCAKDIDEAKLLYHKRNYI